MYFVGILEDLTERVIDSISGSQLPTEWIDGLIMTAPLWRPWIVRLPRGINRIVIEGIRADSNSSGLAVDDIEADYCKNFGTRFCKIERKSLNLIINMKFKMSAHSHMGNIIIYIVF